MGKSSILTCILTCGALVVLVLFNNCSEGFRSSVEGSVHNSSSALPGGVTPTGNVVMTTATSSIMSELNQVKTIDVDIARDGAYANKAITLKVETPEIDDLDVMDGVQVTVTPSTLPAGQTKAQVQVNIGTLSPDFAEHFHLEAWDGQLVISELKVDLAVQPTFRVQIKGMGDNNWYSNGVLLTSLMTPNTRDIPFVHHNAGLQVIFENLSIQEEIVHSSGSIPHQNTNDPMPASADGTTPGGSYMPAAIVGTAISNAPVYSHLHENSTVARKLLFNVDL